MKSRLLLSLSLLTAAALQSWAAAPTQIFASMSYSDRWGMDGGARYGIYELPTSGTPAYFTYVHLSNMLRPSGGCLYFKDTYLNIVPFYTENADEVEYAAWTDFIFFDPQTWEETGRFRLENTDFSANCMAFNAADDTIYGCFFDFDSSKYVFGTLDPKDGSITEIAPVKTMGSIYKAMGFTPDGTCYAINRGGEFGTIELASGEFELIAQTSLGAQGYILTGAVDHLAGVFYYAYGTDDENALYRIDLATGSATKVYDMPDNQNWAGMYITGPEAPDAAPAAATDLAMNFTDASLQGNISFTVPTLTYAGTTLTASDLKADVYVNCVREFTVDVTPGQKVSLDYTAPEDARYTTTVIIRNAALNGAAAYTTRWLGNDVPAPVTDINVSYSDGAFDLTWAPAAAEHGGYINQENVTYTITRYPDGVTVRNIKGTSFHQPMDTPDEITAYHFNISAVYNGHISVPASSDLCYVGALTPPYHQDFEASTSFDALTVIDGNKDKDSWRWYSTSAIIWKSDAGKDLDDWLLLPPMYLEKGLAYDLSFDSSVLGSATERYEVMMGTEPTAEALTTTLIAPKSITNTAYEGTSVKVQVPQTGVYYIGFHAISTNADGYALFLDNINLTAGYSGLDRIDADTVAAPVEYYNLQGIRVENPAAGLYIRRQGTRTEKVIIP